MRGRRSQEGELLPLNDNINRINRIAYKPTDSNSSTSESEMMEERVDEAERRQMQNEYEEPVMPPVMRDYALPVIETSPSCILLDEMSRNYELKNIHFNMLPYFHGAAGEDPLTFMREFYSIITTFPLQRLSEEQPRMRCFPYTMKDVAKQWLMTLPAASLCTWSAVYKKFMGKFYSHQKTAEIRNKIACFTQGDGESFHEAWDRYKLLLNHCPHHRYPLELQNQFFYDGLTLNCQATVDNAAGGAIAEKTMEETFQLFEKLGANSQQKSVRGRKPGVYELKTTPGMVQQMAELSRQNDSAFKDIYDILSKVNVNLPLLEMIQKMPAYAKFFKELNTRKRHYGHNERVMISETVSAVLQQKLPPKLKDPGSFNIDITVGNTKKERAMLDLGASINLMPYSVYVQLGLHDLKPTSMSLLLADRSTRHPRGIIEDILIQVDKLIIPADFVILDMDDERATERDLPILLGRPFMATARTIIDVQNGKLSMTVLDETVEFKVFDSLPYPVGSHDCF
ncbi:hypothetical protein ACOSQ4_011151 [Xanthoceras sorbifolium]